MYVYSVLFSPDRNMITAGGNDGTIQIWNILSGGCDYISVHHSAGVNSICWLDGQQDMSGSSDRTVHRWDVQQAHGSSIYAEYPSGVIDIASSRGSILVASTNRTQKIYDSQSGDVIHTMPPAGLTHCQLSIDGDKILVADKNSGFIWDLSSKTQVQSIRYNGDGATFSPDGIYIASIYGKFLKIWKTHTGHEVQGPSTNLLNEEIHDIVSATDEWLVALHFKTSSRWQVLDVTMGCSLFSFVNSIISVAFSLSFVACL